MSDVKLLGCPFCGGDELTLTTNRHGWNIVECDGCGMRGPCIDLEGEEYLTRWNTRAPQPSPPSEVVAWRWRIKPHDRWEFSIYKPNLLPSLTAKIEPLYAHPNASGELENRAGELLREREIPWLKTAISEAIANLGYGVGMGITPSEAHLEKAADTLFSRYQRMIDLASQGAFYDLARSKSQVDTKEEL